MKEHMEETFEKIKQKRKLPQNFIENIIKEINNNFFMAIGFMLYFIFLIMGSANAVKGVRKIDFNIFSVILLSISIFFFEYGYRKDSGKIAIYGVETLAVAIVTLFLPYVIFEVNYEQKQYYFLIGVYFSVYYMIKTIFICINENKKHRRNNVGSDIKEIVKKEERNYETYKTVNEDYETEEIENNISIKESNKKQEENVETIDRKPKSKRGRPRKKIEEKLKSVISKSKEKVIVTEKAEAKRGRPKKNISIPKENSKHIIEKEKVIVTEKAEVKRGRGRPRKVVS